MDFRTQVRLLGERVGILPGYVNYNGTQNVATPDQTYEAILKALGYRLDAESIREALEKTSSNRSAENNAPLRCVSCAERSSKRQLRGIWANLYSIRSQSNWGVGDFADLRRLIEWAASRQLDFVAVNPLHALRNRGDDVSPYRPVSRLFRNEIYLEIEAIPEFARETAVSSASTQDLRDRPFIDYDAVWSLKRSVLRDLHRKFRAELDGSSSRASEYLAFVAREGQPLRDFATFMALDEQFSQKHGGWKRWPDGLSDSKSAAVERFRRDRADEIDFHQWVQFELDRQLAALAKLAKQKGMAIGLFGDLAIGTAPEGCDPWANPELFVTQVSVGAPPDDLGPAGQNWGLPPVNPEVLRATDFAFWRTLLRRNLAHLGALRVDHVMGLLRQFWIPEGFDGREGAYVQFPADDLFNILAQESQRSGALIIGEDLGTVPAGFRELLKKHGVLSTQVVYFERDWDGQFKPSNSYAPGAYVVVGTHDMVPLAGYAAGRDLELRRQVGLINTDADLEAARQHRRASWNALLARLSQEGVLPSQVDDRRTVCEALIRFLAKSPACMIGISLDDLAEEVDPVNVPGVGQDRYPSWSRKMSKPLQEIIDQTAVASWWGPDASL